MNDEIPSSYKDMDVVMANQTDLVEIVHTLRAVLCVKGAEVQSIIKKVGEVSFPQFQGGLLYMQPVKLGADVSLPDSFSRFNALLERLLAPLRGEHGEVYVTIDERELMAGETHRRPGAHIDGIWQPGLSSHGPPAPPHHSNPRPYTAGGGQILVSNEIGCHGFVGHIDSDAGDGGDMEHARSKFGDPLVMQPGSAYLLNAFGVHESIPVAKVMKRSLVRVSLPESIPVT